MTRDEALEASIKKWNRIVGSTKAEDNGTENCALCGKYWEGDCEGCPVAQKAKDGGCKGTPYSEWTVHHRDAHKSQFLSSLKRVPHCEECLRLAGAERDFLISLREVG